MTAAPEEKLSPAALRSKSYTGLAWFIIALGLMVMLPAWSLRYWYGWAFTGVWAVCTLAVTVYFLKRDPELIQRRLKAGPGAEKEKTQRVIQSAASLVLVATLVFSALDWRFGWSVVPWPVAVAADLLMVFGFYIIYRVFRENSFTSGVIEVANDQRVIATGPYAIVRHPMYSGATLLFLGMPPALGSWWGLIFSGLMMVVLALRILDEEKFLAANLDGYADYRRKTRYRLVPLIW